MAHDSEDELPRRPQPAAFTARDLGPLSIDELNVYIGALEEEILRVRHEIATKQRHRSGAEGLFRR